MTKDASRQHDRELRCIATTLRSDKASPIEMRQSAIDLVNMLSEISGFRLTGSKPADKQETILPFGKALSPIDAARCILGFYRTAQYVRGVEAAIREAQRRFPGERIHVLYGGCGPFAPIAILQTPYFMSDEVVFTLIDVHPRSLEVARRVFEGLSLSDYVFDFVQADVTGFKAEAGAGFHVAVLELMQRALENEPHVAATINLVTQLREGGILVPESVRLTAVLANPSREFQLIPEESRATDLATMSRDRIVLGPVLELDAAQARGFRDRLRESASSLTMRTVTVPPHDLDRYSLAVMTEVRVYGEHVIGEYDDGITLPRYYFDLNCSKGGLVEFTYHIGERPELLGYIT